MKSNFTLPMEAVIHANVKTKQKDLGAVWINVTRDDGPKKFKIFETEIMARQHAHNNSNILHTGLLARIIAEIPEPEVRVTPSVIDDILNGWSSVDTESRQLSIKEYIKLKLFGDKNG